MNCVICAKAEPADGWTVCLGCLNRLDDDLAAIVIITNEAAGWSLHKATTGQPGGSGMPNTVPLRLEVVDAQTGTEALMLLEVWERLVREHLHMSPYAAVWRLRIEVSRRLATPVGEVTIKGSAAFLRAQLAMLAETADFPLDDMAREVRALAGRLRSLMPEKRCRDHIHAKQADQTCRRCIEANRDMEGIPLRCTADHPDADGRTCGWTLRTQGDDPVTCQQCRTTWTPDELLDAHEMDLLPAAVLILLDPDHPNPRKRIAKWAERDRLTQHATTPNPSGGKPLPLYRLGEYRNLLSTTRATETQPDLTSMG